MTFDHPLVISTTPVSITSVKHGVTEVGLSDGRIIRLSIHVEGVKPNPAMVDVSYNVLTEVMMAPQAPISDQHETIQ